jgi:hypothetical protein
VTAPTRLICTPWVTVADLPASKPTLDDDTWTDLTWQASELLYTWSGRQYSGGCVSTVVLDTPPGAAGSAPCWRDWEDPWVPRGDRGVRAQVVALLPDSPVTSIDAVTIGDTDLVADVDYTAQLPAGLVTRTGGQAWPTDGTARITYRHGIMPPMGGQRSAAMLAVELGKAWSGGKCELPKRVTSVARQGLSYDMANADGWGTGIWEIDSWLLSVNPRKQTRRGSAWSPDAAHARRV